MTAELAPCCSLSRIDCLPIPGGGVCCADCNHHPNNPTHFMPPKYDPLLPADRVGKGAV